MPMVMESCFSPIIEPIMEVAVSKRPSAAAAVAEGWWKPIIALTIFLELITKTRALPSRVIPRNKVEFSIIASLFFGSRQDEDPFRILLHPVSRSGAVCGDPFKAARLQGVL